MPSWPGCELQDGPGVNAGRARVCTPRQPGCERRTPGWEAGRPERSASRLPPPGGAGRDVASGCPSLPPRAHTGTVLPAPGCPHTPQAPWVFSVAQRREGLSHSRCAPPAIAKDPPPRGSSPCRGPGGCACLCKEPQCAKGAEERGSRVPSRNLRLQPSSPEVPTSDAFSAGKLELVRWAGGVRRLRGEES